MLISMDPTDSFERMLAKVQLCNLDYAYAYYPQLNHATLQALERQCFAKLEETDGLST